MAPRSNEELEPLYEFTLPCVFSFGAYYESVYSKEEQVKIVKYMVERSLSKKTTEIAIAIITNEIPRLKLIFDDILSQPD